MSSLSHRFAGICILAALFVSGAVSQPGSVHGKVVDDKNSPLKQAHTRLISQSDTLRVFLEESANDSTFRVERVPPGVYRLEITAAGRWEIVRSVSCSNGTVDLGPITLAEQPILLREVTVEGRVPPAIQKGDTTEYNARAFTVDRDPARE